MPCPFPLKLPVLLFKSDHLYVFMSAYYDFKTVFNQDVSIACSQSGFSFVADSTDGKVVENKNQFFLLLQNICMSRLFT